MKLIDERRARATGLVDLFDDDVNGWRQELIQSCEDAIFDDQDSISTRPREILWRKGYYDTISMAKRFIHKHRSTLEASRRRGENNTNGVTLDGMDKLCLFIEDGILRLKKIIIRIEKDYNLDLKFIVDFTLFENGEIELPLEPEDIPINKKITSLDIINFALESIHSLIVSLGDLHRYYLDFGLQKQFNRAITPELTAQYYEEAFKLNPKNGMPQNQLGTLWIGKNYNLDSVYHYLYSLVCAKPFELSEDNVVKIFNQSAAYLEQLKMPIDYQVNMRDFMARFLLVVDIFFFDKNVPTFNDLCRFLLCDLNSMLQAQDEETGKSVFTQDSLFKLISILFFCMAKLKRINSPKVFPLNAFLAAACDQLVETCHRNFEEYFEEHAVDNEQFLKHYQQIFEMYAGEKQQQREKELFNGQIKSRSDGLLSGTSTGEGSSNNELIKSSGDQSGGGGVVSKTSSGGSGDAGRRNLTTAAAVAPKKKVIKYRRRRRRSTYTSDSDLTSNFDSDSERSDEDEFNDDSEDGSYEESEPEEAHEINSELEGNIQRQDGANGYHLNGQSNHLHFTDDDDDDDDGSDVIIEEETVVMVNGKTNPESNGRQQIISKEIPTNDFVDKFQEMTFEDEAPLYNGTVKENRTRHRLGNVKYDPNLLLKFLEDEPTISAIKILFDWLMDNKEILWECFQSNKEFVRKMIGLLNVINVNIFTRRVFFDRQLLTVDGLREDIRGLFDARGKLPIKEDIQLKHFGEFAKAQMNLDWELPTQLKITRMEDNLLRVIKLKTFGFFICDRRKFGYGFRNCRFEEVDAEQSIQRKNAKKAGRRATKGMNGRMSECSGSGENRRERRRRQRRALLATDRNNNDNDGGRRRRGQNNRGESGVVNGGRQQQQNRRGGGLREERGNGDAKLKDDPLTREREQRKKGELMGKLWLRNEVKTLENKVRIFVVISSGIGIWLLIQ